MLKKAFQKQFEGIIWKIRPDETAGRLVLEIRDPQQKQAFFSCIRTADGKPGFERLQLREPWFCGLEAVAHGHAFLHGYLSETLPEHRGIFACRLENGEIAWEDYNLVFSHPVAEGIIAWNYKSEPRRYQLINPANGSHLRSFSSPEDLEQNTSALSFQSIHLPRKITLEKNRLEQLPSGTLPAADLLEYKTYRLLAFYVERREDTTASKEEKMDHYLLVTSEQKEVIHKDLLDEGILQRAMDTFFVIGNQICYIKRKSEILAYFL